MCVPALASAAPGLSGLSGFQAAGLGIRSLQTIFQTLDERAVAETARTNIETDRLLQQAQLSTRAGQEADQTTQAKIVRQRQAIKEIASIRVNASASGVGGLISDRLAGDASFRAGEDLRSIDTNFSNLTQQRNLDRRAINAQAKSRRNQATKPNFLDAGLTILGDAVGTAAENPKRRNKKA